MGYKPRHVVARVWALSWRTRVAIVAAVALATAGGGVAYAAISDVPVTNGQLQGQVSVCVSQANESAQYVELHNPAPGNCAKGYVQYHANASQAAAAADDDSAYVKLPLHFTQDIGGTSEDCVLEAAASGSAEPYVAHCGGAITSSASATFTVGATTNTFSVTTGAFSSTAALSESGTLPAGVTFKDNGDGTATLSETGALTSSDVGTYKITISAQDGTNATQDFTLVVASAT